MPSVGLLLAHQDVGQIMDYRLSMGFDVVDVEHVQWMHLLLFIGFLLGYFSGGNKTATRLVDTVSIEAQRLVRPIVLMALSASLLPSLLALIWGNSAPNDYISSYTVLRGAPVLVQQIHGVLNQLQFSSLVAAVVVVIAAKPYRHSWVAFFLALNMIHASLSGGSRTVAFLAFLSYVVASSIFVRGFTLRRAVTYVFPALILFMIAGMLRDQNDDAGLLYLFQTGEFTALFINTIDLKERFAAGWGEEVRFAIYLVDVLRLIPSQLIGGTKLDPAQWYSQTFYPEYSDAGGGFAFGVLSESAVGFGVPEAAIRGLILGILFRYLRNYLMGDGATIAKIFTYVWLTAVCYQCYRDTTFSVAVRALYQVLPVILVMRLFRSRDSRPPSVRNSSI
ncbi:hypothetical protein [Limnobacter sp.]|uniref:hypothetical protein n=1 Tax=Limnobacter sp. TaxID=2003368 RepID=UPI003513B5E8